jgi:hypothetical protein
MMVVLSKRGDAGGDPPSFGGHGGRDCRIGEHSVCCKKMANCFRSSHVRHSLSFAALHFI